MPAMTFMKPYTVLPLAGEDHVRFTFRALRVRAYQTNSSRWKHYLSLGLGFTLCPVFGSIFIICSFQLSATHQINLWPCNTTCPYVPDITCYLIVTRRNPSAIRFTDNCIWHPESSSLISSSIINSRITWTH